MDRLPGGIPQRLKMTAATSTQCAIEALSATPLIAGPNGWLQEALGPHSDLA